MLLSQEENKRDLQEIPDNIKRNLDIRPVRWIDEVLALALQEMPVPKLHDEAESTLPKQSGTVVDVKETDNSSDYCLILLVNVGINPPSL